MRAAARRDRRARARAGPTSRPPPTSAAFARAASAGRSCSRRREAATTARASPRVVACRGRRRGCGAVADGVRLLAEELVDFTRELAALVARSPSRPGGGLPGGRDGAGRRRSAARSYAPAPGLSTTTRWRPSRPRCDIAGDLDVVGLLAVELFDTADGVLVNELAMRPHNSGHWTHRRRRDLAVRAAPARRARPAARRRRADARRTPSWSTSSAATSPTCTGYLHCMARDPGLQIHVYGKDVKPGRKVGHVTVTGDDLDDAARARPHAAAYLRGDIDE